MTNFFRGLAAILAFVLIVEPAQLAAQPAKKTLRIVTLGDSITRGARPGVNAHETFAARLEQDLKQRHPAVEVVNVGIGGERTDQAIKRLADVIARKPALVTIMYGTNDSYVDRGKTDSRLTLAEYRANLEKIVDDLRAKGVTPILMTEPRWGKAAKANGVGEHPNVRLEKYVETCRAVAAAKKTPLVDHWRIWTEHEMKGVDVGSWTTDQCHPNPQGHRVMADAISPVVAEALKRK
jgi:acyl-CoA thioesterase-1